jgi:hypothetical protein
MLPGLSPTITSAWVRPSCAGALAQSAAVFVVVANSARILRFAAPLSRD